MQIFKNLFGAHSANLEMAMDRTSQRAGLLTKNLSNVNTPGYKRMDTDFGITLAGHEQSFSERSAAIRAQSKKFQSLDVNDIRQNRLGVNRQLTRRGLFDNPDGTGDVTRNPGSVRIDGNSVDLEKEVMSIAETQLRYELLTEMTSRYFSGIKSVIREGK